MKFIQPGECRQIPNALWDCPFHSGIRKLTRRSEVITEKTKKPQRRELKPSSHDEHFRDSPIRTSYAFPRTHGVGIACRRPNLKLRVAPSLAEFPHDICICLRWRIVDKKYNRQSKNDDTKFHGLKDWIGQNRHRCLDWSIDQRQGIHSGHTYGLCDPLWIVLFTAGVWWISPTRKVENPGSSENLPIRRILPFYWILPIGLNN